jgi:hypothetical protein
MKKLISLMLLGMMVITAPGCDMLSSLNVTSLLNLSALGWADIAGPSNPLVPDNDKWNDAYADPTCIIPGYCGPNPWYPTSTGTTADSD